MADRQAELQELLDRLVASARARRIRTAWAEASEHLRLEHRPAPRLFDDIVEGSVDGFPVRIVHLVLLDIVALTTVVSVGGLATIPGELVLEAEDVLGAYDWARAGEAARSSEAATYRSLPTSVRDLDPGVRALLRGDGGGIGAALRGGAVEYHHAGPFDDAVLLVSVIRALAALAYTLGAAPDAIPDQLLTQAQTAESAAVRERCADVLRRCYPTRPHTTSLPPRA